MKANPESVIPLTVHGNQVYEALLLERLMKNEEARAKAEEEAKRKRLAEELAHPFPDLSDEEANEDIR